MEKKGIGASFPTNTGGRNESKLVGGGLLISANDQTILAMLSRYPGMSRREADNYLSRIESPDNVQVAKVVIGRMWPEQLSGEARATYDEFHLWSLDRTRRFLNEQVDSRRN